ncbi:hypothetical protein HBH77_172500 [Parastagonospora nodorum]|nr:hypothetical protein HBH77_172500 [Parastagonospora nodorum]
MSKGKDLIRLFKLQSLAPFKSWRSPIEHKKVALRQSHLVATGHALLHLVPLCGAITLLILHWSQYFVGPSFDLSTTLQFVAKLHELLMQTSIVEIVLCVIRAQAIEGFIPLGALSATTQALHISYIWSIDFLGATTSPSLNGSRKVLFVVLVPVLIALTALVGPSSATLMIPRPGSSSLRFMYPWGSTRTFESTFLSHLDAKQNLTLDFESFKATYNFKVGGLTTSRSTIIQTYSNNKDVPRDSIIPRALQYIGKGDLTIATIPTQLSTRVLNTLSIDVASNETTSIKLPRPVVVARCGNMSELKASSPITYFLDDGDSTGTISSFKDLVKQHVDLSNSTNTLIDSLLPIWDASPEPGFSSYIANFITDHCASSSGSKSYPISALLHHQNQTTNSCPTFLTCTVSAYWQISEHEMIGSDGGLQQVRTAPLAKLGFKMTQDARQITIDWDDIPSFKSARFSNLTLSSDASLSLAVSLATVISEVSWQAGQWSSDPSSETDQQTQWYISKIAHGYGYGTSSTSVRLSLIVITTYCIATVAYITYMLVSGHTSTAWHSATELVVLALQSKPTEHLGHISVGINSMQTHREAVGIRVNDNKRLELVLSSDSNVRARKLRRVLPNMAY